MIKICTHCHSPIPKVRQNAQTKYCSITCRRHKHNQDYKFANGRSVDLPSGIVGAIAELTVCADLLNKGYEVFRSVSQSCSCDMVAMKNGELKRVEVSSGWTSLDGKHYDTGNKIKEQHKYDLLAIYYHRDNTIVYTPELS